MNQIQKSIVLVLTAVCITGSFGIPLGDPKFLVEAFSLEFSFIALAVISAKNIRYAYIPNFIIAIMVIVGNTISPKHIEIMSTLHPFYNAIVLIVGGYILQGLLLVTNTISYKKYKAIPVSKTG
jgi:phosphoglycerol transferase MdoB-like AlkP superfamily enzyme